jgi:hypothetical protein
MRDDDGTAEDPDDDVNDTDVLPAHRAMKRETVDLLWLLRLLWF